MKLSKILEHVVRAKIAIERVSSAHTFSCPSEDPHMAGPCSCGAGETETAKLEALKHLNKITDAED